MSKNEVFSNKEADLLSRSLDLPSSLTGLTSPLRITIDTSLISYSAGLVKLLFEAATKANPICVTISGVLHNKTTSGFEVGFCQSSNDYMLSFSDNGVFEKGSCFIRGGNADEVRENPLLNLIEKRLRIDQKEPTLSQEFLISLVAVIAQAPGGLDPFKDQVQAVSGVSDSARNALIEIVEFVESNAI